MITKKISRPDKSDGYRIYDLIDPGDKLTCWVVKGPIKEIRFTNVSITLFGTKGIHMIIVCRFLLF
jgi:hypothetical protein